MLVHKFILTGPAQIGKSLKTKETSEDKEIIIGILLHYILGVQTVL